MVFLCFSIKDRNNLINDFNQYLQNFGIDTWYDRKNIFLGDNRIKINIDEGVKSEKVNYAIIFYSENFKNGNICQEEYKILENRYNNDEIHIFPVFLNTVPKNIDTQFKLCLQLVYKVINDYNDFYPLSLHIISKITADHLKDCLYKNLNEIIEKSKNKESAIITLLIEYEKITATNYQMRLGLLFGIFNILLTIQQISIFHKKTIFHIFYENCITPLKEEKREMLIFENILIYELNRTMNATYDF